MADRVVLWVAKDDFEYLPSDVLALRAHGLEIRECADLRSYKKLVPALRMWPDAYFVTADDDVYYPPGWLESLVNVAQRHPDVVVGGRVHLAKLDSEGWFEPYAAWELATDRSIAAGPETRLFPTGVGGVLYPVGAFAEGVLDESTFLDLCPRGDDIWFFWMCRLAGTEQRRADSWFDIVAWPDSQDVALFTENMQGQGNDRQIKAMEERYGPVP